MFKDSREYATLLLMASLLTLLLYAQWCQNGHIIETLDSINTKMLIMEANNE